MPLSYYLEDFNFSAFGTDNPFALALEEDSVEAGEPPTATSRAAVGTGIGMGAGASHGTASHGHLGLLYVGLGVIALGLAAWRIVSAVGGQGRSKNGGQGAIEIVLGEKAPLLHSHSK